MIHVCLRALAIALAATAVSAAAETLRLDRDGVIRRAREQAPELLAERERLGIALGRLQQARLWPYNPTLDLSGGPRTGDDETTLDYGVGVSLRLPLSTRRAAATALAAAEADGARAGIADRRRAVVLAAVRRHLETLRAEQRVAQARSAVTLAERVVAATSQRHAAGDANELDSNVAAIARARALAEQRQAEAEATASRDRLAALLGIDPETPVIVSGTLDWPVPAIDAVDAILQRRPDLARLAAGRRAAEAEVELAAGRAGIDPSLSLGYEREEGADVVHLGLSIELPVAERGQGDRAAALASARFAQRRLEAEALRVRAEVLAAIERARALRDAASGYQEAIVPRLEANERLTDAAFRTGSLSFSDVLSQQREVLAAREELLAIEYAAAVAAAEAAAAAALPPFAEKTSTQEVPPSVPTRKETP